jgi:hypothetical protein
MVDNLKIRIAKFIAPKYYEEIDNRVNIRVAKIISSMDPFEPLYKKFNGIFSEEFTRPEEKLDERSQILIKTLGYQLHNDQSFKYLTSWIMNSQINSMFKSPTRTNEERGEVLMWGKAQIASVLLLLKEIERLSSKYEEMLNKEDTFDKNIIIE